MSDLSIFDIIGPVMVGPSSSHTAGAVKISKVARKFAKGKIKKVIFHLHGSFAKTHKGHGTDKALLGGIIGLDEADERLINSFEIADEKGIKYEFVEDDLGDVHPNTVLIEMFIDDTVVKLQGSSIGGGAIEINKVNDLDIKITGEFPTLVVHHLDQKGAVSKITGYLALSDINIAYMSVFRKTKGKSAFTIVEVDEYIPEDIIGKLKNAFKEILDVIIVE